MLNKLMQIFATLPGLGPKSAKRIVLHMVNNKDATIHLTNLLSATLDSIVSCSQCNNIDNASPCNICGARDRDKSKICIVESIEDLWNIESSQHYKGLYYVLNAKSDQSSAIQEISIDTLLPRIRSGEVGEIILANSPTITGQTNAFYITDVLKKENDALSNSVVVTVLGRGIPIGSEIDYLDENTICAAFQSRKNVD